MTAKFPRLARFYNRLIGKGPKLPVFGREYLDHLVGQYKESGTESQIVKDVIERYTSRPEDVGWGDVYSIERALVACLPPEELRRSLWAARFRLKQIAGGEAFEAYEKSAAPDDKASVEQLRADLQRILELLHWYYSLLPLRNEIRKRYIISCIVCVDIYTLVLGLVFLRSRHCHWDPSVGLIASIIYCGVVGGFVSSLRRLQDVHFGQGDPIVAIYGLKSASYFMWLSPMLGAVFAVVLALLFVAGAVTGSLFPNFGTTGSQCASGLSAFAKAVLPATTKDYGLLLAWSFIAGFAERFVPDNLDKMIAGQKPK